MCGVGYLYPHPVREERHVTWDGRQHTTLAGGQLEAVADELPRPDPRNCEQLVEDLGGQFHRDYGVVLRAVLFAVDSHAAKITAGLSAVGAVR